MLQRNRTIHANSMAVFLLGALFLFLSIGLVMLGGSVYRQATAASAENDNLRTTLAYLANQVRRHDSAGSLEVGELEGIPALCLYQEIEDFQLATYLYCYEGALRELFVERGYELGPEAGLAIMVLEDLSLSWTEQGLLQIVATLADGTAGELLLAPRSAAEGGATYAILP